MIHGRSQEGKDPVILKNEWLDALNNGLTRADIKLPEDTTIEFPYYGDLLAKLVKDVANPLDSNIHNKGENSDLENELQINILIEIAKNAGITDADVTRELGDVPSEKGLGNRKWVQAIMRAFDRIPGLNSKVIDVLTRDVYVYLTYPGVRRQIDREIANALGDGPCVVLSHSLGTVVAYNVLYSRPIEPQYPRFITVGSPLGIQAIRQYIESPLKSPPCIGNWFNAYDAQDFVALRPLDTKNFDVRPAIENKSDVINFTTNRHGIDGYLADPVVARKIVELLV